MLSTTDAASHAPDAEVFTTEHYGAALPDGGSFTDLGHRDVPDCRVEPKDPPGAFVTP